MGVWFRRVLIEWVVRGVWEGVYLKACIPARWFFAVDALRIRLILSGRNRLGPEACLEIEGEGGLV